jgi:hypothetical protein
LESALDSWPILLKGRWVLLDDWIAFLKEESPALIKRDEWCVF